MTVNEEQSSLRYIATKALLESPRLIAALVHAASNTAAIRITIEASSYVGIAPALLSFPFQTVRMTSSTPVR